MTTLTTVHHAVNPFTVDCTALYCNARCSAEFYHHIFINSLPVDALKFFRLHSRPSFSLTSLHLCPLPCNHFIFRLDLRQTFTKLFERSIQSPSYLVCYTSSMKYTFQFSTVHRHTVCTLQYISVQYITELCTHPYRQSILLHALQALPLFSFRSRTLL